MPQVTQKGRNREAAGPATLPAARPVLAVFVGIAPAGVTWLGMRFRLYFQVMALGTGAFLLWSRREAKWPFAKADSLLGAQ